MINSFHTLGRILSIHRTPASDPEFAVELAVTWDHLDPVRGVVRREVTVDIHFQGPFAEFAETTLAVDQLVSFEGRFEISESTGTLVLVAEEIVVLGVYGRDFHASDDLRGVA